MDYAHKQTDIILEQLEKSVSAVYKTVDKELAEQVSDFLDSFTEQDEAKRKQVEQGTLTERDYKAWRKREIEKAQEYTEVVKNAAEIAHNANVAAQVSDYIERQAALDAIEVCLERDAKNACLDLCVDDPDLSRCMARYNVIKAVRKLVEERPAANVREDVQGEWIFKQSYFGTDECNCSLCGQFLSTRIGERMPFCPNCGARMLGGEEQ